MTEPEQWISGGQNVIPNHVRDTGYPITSWAAAKLRLCLSKEVIAQRLGGCLLVGGVIAFASLDWFFLFPPL